MQFVNDDDARVKNDLFYQTKYLKTIAEWMTFFGWVTILSIVVALGSYFMAHANTN